MLAPLPCLAVGAATNSVARRYSVSMFCIRYGMDLGLLCYTGSPVSARRATLESPDSTACLLAPALNSLVWLVALLRCLRAFTSLTMSSDSSASPGIEAARLATLPGRLHTPDSSSHPATARQTHASVEYLR